MKCPQCEYESSMNQLRCNRCHTAYDRAELERLHHLEYLLVWLDKQDANLNLTHYLAMRASIIQERDSLLSALLPAPKPEPEPAPPPPPLPQMPAAPITPIPPPAPPPVKDDVPDTPPDPAPVSSKPPPPPIDVQVPRINWNSLGDRLVEAAVSGTLLRGLLYLGAFMIIVSLTILVVRFWDVFPVGAQLGFIAAVPTLFYAAGWWVRQKLDLPQAGGVLMGIGAVLVAVDFAAVYQFSGLAGRVDVLWYWLLASLVCTAVYTLTAWRYPIEFFGYITLLGFTSTMMAMTLAAGLSVGWLVTAVALTALLILPLAHGLGQASKQWAELARAAQRLPWVYLLLTLPISLLVLPFDYWAGVTGLALTTALVLALAWQHQEPRLVLGGAGLFIVPFSLAFFRWLTWQHLPQPWAWLMVAWVGLAILYFSLAIACHHWLFTADLSPFTVRHFPLGTAVWLTVWAHLLAWLALVGLVAVFMLRLWGWMTIPTLSALAGVIGLYLASAALHHHGRYPAISYYLNSDLPPWLARSFYLWPVPLLTAVWVAVAWPDGDLMWLMGVGLAGLALVYLVLGQILAPIHTAYRLPWHTVVYPLLLAALGIAFFSFSAYVWLPTLVLTILCLGGLSAIYGREVESFIAIPLCIQAFKLAYIEPPFLWMVMPVVYEVLSVFLESTLPVAHVLHAFLESTVPVAYGVLALACLLAGWMLATRAQTQTDTQGWWQIYRRPLQAAAAITWVWSLLVTVIGTIMILGRGDEQMAGPTIVAQLLAVFTLILAARLYRARWPLFLAPWLLFWPVTLTTAVFSPVLLGRPLTMHEYSLVWLGLAAVYLLAGFVLDHARQDYAHGVYLGGYGLAAVAVVWAWPNDAVTAVVLGAAIFMALVSQWLMHMGRHDTYTQLCLLLWPKPQEIVSRLFRAGFLFLAVYAFPVWLARLFLWQAWGPAWLGLALASTAVLYVAMGVMLQPVRWEYGWPLFTAGYALTAVAALLAILAGDLQITIVVLGMVSGLYFVSTLLFRQVGWLYLANGLLPVIVLLVLADHGWLTAARTAVSLMALACVYVGVGRLLDKGRRPLPHVSRFAVPFYLYGYPLSVTALLLSFYVNQSSFMIQLFCAGAVLYSISAWAFRTSFFLYPALLLTSATYYLALGFIPVSPVWMGVAWLPLLLVYLLIGEVAFGGERQEMGSLADLRRRFNPAEWEAPFFLAAYMLSVFMVGQSWGAPLPRTIALAAAALLYFEAALMFNTWLWLYPALLAVHAALASFFTINPTSSAPPMLVYPFHGLTWLLTWVGYVLSQKAARGQQPEIQPFTPLTHHLITPAWAQPFLLFAVLDVMVWQMVAALDMRTAVVIAAGHALLLGLLAQLWRDRLLPYGALCFAVLAAMFAALDLNLASGTAVAVAAAGLALYLLGWGLNVGRIGVLWSAPLRHMGTAVTSLALCLTLPLLITSPSMAALTLILAGAQFLASAVCQRTAWLSYLGVALMEAAWVVLLLDWNISQPQWYALPIGLYLVFVGQMERRFKASHTHSPPFYASYLEGFGLTIILFTSFIQSLHGLSGFPYFVLLLAESLIVMGWAALQRVKVPFFMGMGACVLNVVAQVIVLVNVLAISRWVVVLGVGLALVITAVFIERKREEIRAQTKLWRDALELWQ